MVSPEENALWDRPPQAIGGLEIIELAKTMKGVLDTVKAPQLEGNPWRRARFELLVFDPHHKTPQEIIMPTQVSCVAVPAKGHYQLRVTTGTRFLDQPGVQLNHERRFSVENETPKCWFREFYFVLDSEHRLVDDLTTGVVPQPEAVPSISSLQLADAQAILGRLGVENRVQE